MMRRMSRVTRADAASAYGSSTGHRESVSGSGTGRGWAGHEEAGSRLASRRSSRSQSSLAPSVLSEAPRMTEVQAREDAEQAPRGSASAPPAVNLGSLKGLQEALEMAELALAQQRYLREHLIYKDVPLVRRRTWGPARGNKRRPSLELLWEYKCPLTAGLVVTCITWNKVQGDLLAVGYGSRAFGPPRKGRVSVWSVKNPEQPLWSCQTSSGVTCLDFSHHNPNMLAAGLRSGCLKVYDVKLRQGGPLMASKVGGAGHGDPIWQVQWVDCGSERGEALTTIATDGYVIRWSIAQGLEPRRLMQLKRVNSKKAEPNTSSSPTATVVPPPASQGRAPKTEALITRHSGGFCLDFQGPDGSLYIAGTDEGLIHKCSTAYLEQSLGLYSGHLAPVYRVQWSPFCPGIFLSASADWTMNIWVDSKDTPVLSLFTEKEEVTDAGWCSYPVNAAGQHHCRWPASTLGLSCINSAAR
eukprot:jgi/Botrbrau1/371/Bobra.110_2s0027.1